VGILLKNSRSSKHIRLAAMVSIPRASKPTSRSSHKPRRVRIIPNPDRHDPFDSYITWGTYCNESCQACLFHMLEDVGEGASGYVRRFDLGGGLPSLGFGPGLPPPPVPLAGAAIPPPFG